MFIDLKGKHKTPQKINVYNKYIKKRDLRFHIRQETLPFLFEDEEADLSRYLPGSKTPTSKFSESKVGGGGRIGEG